MIKRASEVITFQLELATLTEPTNQPTPCGHEVVPQQVKAPRSPLDDWWVGYHSNADIVFEEEEDYHGPPPPSLMHLVYDVDPLLAPRRVARASYHELGTLLDRWVAPGPDLPVTLPPDPMQPTPKDTASWVPLIRRG
ncbi:hypothetical protein HAX54_048801 [Datura stramonium]|uniref:Uncharacterized protein n=1 Tax=Datura stramonium TaxID=4076 RepID=A0ABS8WJP1_DATST|nr:hypothetical protein [Datura stramonium]